MTQFVKTALEFLPTLDLSTCLIFMVAFVLCLWLLSLGRSEVNWPPGPVCFPVVGNLPQLMVSGRRRQPTDFLPWYDKYGDIMHVKLAEQHMVMLGTYDLIHDAFVKNAETVSARPTWVYLIERMVGRDGAGVTFASGEKWRQLRRMTLSSLRDLGVGKKGLQERIQDEARYLVQSIEEKNGKPFSPSENIGKAVSNITSTFVFGKRHDYKSKPEMLPVMEEVTRTWDGILVQTNLARFIVPAKKLIALIDRLYGLIRQEVEQHQKSYDANDIRDFVDIYIKVTQEGRDPKIYGEWNVFHIIFDLYLAGTDTTANTLRWSLIHMMNGPDVQRKVQQEIDEVLGQGRVARYEDKVNMPYTEATILEILRMSPVDPFGVPHATSETVKLAGYTIPKGTLVLADIYRVLHDENNFHDPYTFKPERWLDSEGKVVKSEKLIPFSIGPRSCLGRGLAEMEAFIFFTTLLQNFTFKVPEGEAPPNGIEGANKGTFTPYPYNVVATRR